MDGWTWPRQGPCSPSDVKRSGAPHCATSALTSAHANGGDSDLAARTGGTPSRERRRVGVQEVRDHSVSTKTRLLSPSGEHQ